MLWRCTQNNVMLHQVLRESVSLCQLVCIGAGQAMTSSVPWHLYINTGDSFTAVPTPHLRATGTELALRLPM